MAGAFYVKTMSKSSEVGYISRAGFCLANDLEGGGTKNKVKKFWRNGCQKAFPSAYTVRGNLKGVRQDENVELQKLR